MKKLLVLGLSLVFVFSLAGCASAKKVGHEAGNAGKEIGHAFKDAGHQIAQAVKNG